jgi:uncharacterized protein
MPPRIPDSYEVRDFVALDLRASDDKDGFDGYASTHWAVDSYGTAMAPGAAKKSIKERAGQVLVLWQHDPATIIGVPSTLKEDRTGLYTETDVITQVQAGADALSYLRGGVPLGMSIGFQTVRDRSGEDNDPLDFTHAPDWAKKLPKSEIRVITEYKLWEYSLVTFAANAQAKPTKIRSELDADTLSLLLDDLRAGRLDAEWLALVDQIVAARQDAGPGGETPPPTSEDEARRHAVDLELTLLELSEFLLEDAA